MATELAVKGVPPDLLEFIKPIAERMALIEREVVNNSHLSAQEKERIRKNASLDRDEAIAWRLVHDQRMCEVWPWYADTIIAGDTSEKKWGISLLFFARTAAQLPGKPSNLTVREREKYFQQVRKHANALMELLYRTRYDCIWLDDGRTLTDDFDEYITDPDNRKDMFFIEDIGKYIWEKLQSATSWVMSEGGELLLAYRVDELGITELPFDYPHCHLNGLLLDVINWTHQDELWGRGVKTSKPIRMSGEGAQAHYFNVTLFERFLYHYGVQVPFKILATLANVVLDLPPEKLMDDDTARKQVTRYFEKIGLPKDVSNPRIRPGLRELPPDDPPF